MCEVCPWPAAWGGIISHCYDNDLNTVQGRRGMPKGKPHLVKVPGVVVAGHFVDDGRDAVADVGEGPLLVLEERVPLHRIRTVETQAGRPAIQTETIHDMHTAPEGAAGPSLVSSDNSSAI